jgi:hypothetical protein
MSAHSRLGSARVRPTRRLRSHSARLLAGTLVTGLAVAGVAAASAQNAGAAAPLRAQSVGRFVDGAAGGQPIQKIADVQDARATAPGTQSPPNPLNVTLLGQINLPLTGVINLSTAPAIVAGAVNQVAVAHDDGFSYGAAGAVSNSGGVNLGGQNGAFPALGTIDLSGAALPSLPSLPLPGVGSLASLGSITASVGAVSALAQTKSGGAVTPAPRYAIAGLNFSIGSPALGGALKTVVDALALPTLPGVPGIPTECELKAQMLSPLSLAGGAIEISPTTGTITVRLAKLLAELGLDINSLPANTDLLAYLLDYLTDPGKFAAGLQKALTDLTTPLQSQFTKCLAALPAPLNALQGVFDLVTSGQKNLTDALDAITGPLAQAAGSNPLAPLANGLKQLIDIGVNVESGPGIQPVQSNPAFRFTTKLAKTPNQATPVVADQTLVRALEINLLPAAGGSGAVTVALANAAVGPGTVVAPSSSAGLGVEAASTQLPTAVPAGAAKPAGSPALPLTLLALGLVLAGGGAVAWKLRGRHV